MKKIKKIGIIFLIIVICSIIFIKEKFLKEEPFVWQAKYIWAYEEKTEKAENSESETEEKTDSKDEEEVNPYADTWTCFRKKFHIDNERDIKNIIAKIAVDSKYWLYINDEMVVREGQLKRGEKPDSIYYDEIDLTPYLKEGENTIAVLVWYFGRNSYSHIDSKQGALLFQTKIGDKTIISDDTWKVIKNPAYLKDTPIQNKRLSESNVYYDANSAIDNWYKSDYNDSSWEDAYVYGKAGEKPWGELIARNIPQFKNSEIKEYENFEQYRNYVPKEDEILELKVPYNMQLTPYLKVEAKANSKITILTDKEYDEKRKAQKTTYITKEGVQEFESLPWINGDKIYYYIPAGVKIISLGYRQTGYDTEMSGKFISNDKFFNELWNMANRTLYLNMRDNYMDCPDRERAEWWADASVSMEQAMYGLDTNANYLYEKAVKSLIGWRHEDVLMTINPSTTSNMHLPVQMLLGIGSMYEYYEYTGEKEFLEYVYPYIKNYLNMWTIKENGLIHLNNYYALWPWGDSAGECDYIAIENAWYYYALTNLYKMAEELEYETDIIELQGKINTIYNGYNQTLWKENGYKEYNGENFDIRANAVAILSGLASEDKYEVISKILIENMDNSTVMEKYVLEALCKIGKTEEAQERIKTRYSIMVENQEYSSTLWEYWQQNTGSKNHAWSGGPLVIMSKYFAGIEPLKPGYSEISIKPNFGNLNSIESEVNTVKGKIYLKATKNENEIKLDIDVPTKTLVAIEKTSENPSIEVNGKTIYKNGEQKFNLTVKYDSEDEKYIYFYINKGDYIFKSK